MLAELSFPRWPQGPSAPRLSWPRCPGKGQTAGHTPPYCGQMTSMKLASWSRWKPLCEARRWNVHPCPSTQRGVCVCVCVCDRGGEEQLFPKKSSLSLSPGPRYGRDAHVCFSVISLWHIFQGGLFDASLWCLILLVSGVMVKTSSVVS